MATTIKVHRPSPHRFDRISVVAEQMGGVPCVRETRIPVVTVWRLASLERPWSEIRSDFPDLTIEDCSQAVAFVHASLIVADVVVGEVTEREL